MKDFIRNAVTTHLRGGWLTFMSIFTPNEGYFITPVLINTYWSVVCNVAVWR
jgi:hypothetical protein